jgi:putative membrane protein
MPDDSKPTPRNFLAVERTFLAWIRTGLALMGLGFVLARFGIFLREFSLNQPSLPRPSSGLSLWFGTALIFLGVLVCLLSLARYRRLLQQLQQSEAMLSRPSTLAMMSALVLTVLGVAMAIYLIPVKPIAGNHSSMAEEIFMAPSPKQGILRIPSKLSVDETVARLQTILHAKGVKLFTIVDHSGEAASAGLKMPNTKLLIFGNPKAGTPLMLATPSVALDLPLKILVA